MKMFPAEGDFRSLLSQFPEIMLEYPELTPAIVVTMRGDSVNMQWTCKADFNQYRVMEHRIHIRALQAKMKLCYLEKEAVNALKGAVMADMRGNLHRAHYMRKRARNSEITKPPAFFVGEKDYSPPINKANFDLLIGLDNELTEIEDKLQKFPEDGNHDQYQKLEKEWEDKLLMFSGIMVGLLHRIIPQEVWNEPLAEFFRRIDPRLMGCDACFDPLNIMPCEWEVPAKIINCLHMEMLLLHWLIASFVPRAQPAPPQFMDGTVQSQNAPRFIFEIFSSQWNLQFLVDFPIRKINVVKRQISQEAKGR